MIFSPLAASFIPNALYMFLQAPPLCFYKYFNIFHSKTYPLPQKWIQTGRVCTSVCLQYYLMAVSKLATSCLELREKYACSRWELSAGTLVVFSLRVMLRGVPKRLARIPANPNIPFNLLTSSIGCVIKGPYCIKKRKTCPPSLRLGK